ncbi:AGE family epimerase/isomerase [Cucumibacter marinus]|uniref:AGE family epimerase/isomerase n=1 Tax=Cucumibacter marinus TaxID=1121252 RepID=UPI0003F924A6|nr:AGE family epimerase/isomerase [Cucumibacter marinus]
MQLPAGRFRTPDFLVGQIRSIIDFYYPVSIDHHYGGFINQLRDDGTVFDSRTKHLVGTTRFIYNYATAGALLGDQDLIRAARHGIEFLDRGHRQPDGSFAWILDRNTVRDATLHAYGHAFVVLAAAAALRADIQEARPLLEQAWCVLEERLFEPEHGLYADEIPAGSGSVPEPYRGQNANMHLCEAFLLAFETTGDQIYLDRAALLAERICLDLAAHTKGLIWEHYRSDWTPDFIYNQDNPKDLFRPFGYLPGHFIEWAKLLVLLDNHRPAEWRLERAEALFDTAMASCWDADKGGIAYSYTPERGILDTDRYYWVIAEAIAASALLAGRTGRTHYWDWYDRLWSYAEEFFIDAEYGGWYRVLDRAGNRYSDEKSPAAKTDYHPLSACMTALDVIGRQRG